MKLRKFIAVCGLCVCAAGVAAAQTVTLAPIDGQASISSGVWSMQEGGISLNMGRYSSVNIDRRAVLEFPIGSIPNGATITSAVLTIPIVSYNSPPNPVFEFHGYLGDGVLNPSDATEPFNLIGTSPAIDNLATFSVPIDLSYVQSAVAGSATHLGMYGYPESDNTQASIEAVEWSPSGGARLVISYVPEPASLVMLLLCGMCARRR